VWQTVKIWCSLGKGRRNFSEPLSSLLCMFVNDCKMKSQKEARVLAPNNVRAAKCCPGPSESPGSPTEDRNPPVDLGVPAYDS
jgi:hypothetical protein